MERSRQAWIAAVLVTAAGCGDGADCPAGLVLDPDLGYCVAPDAGAGDAGQVDAGASDAGDAGPACDGGARSLCGTDCVDLQTDPANCGMCGNGCTTGLSCVAANCTDPVVDVAITSTHGCAVTSTGALWCWGENATGQLGNGTLLGSAVPIHVDAIRDAAQVTVSSFSFSTPDGSTCVRTHAGALLCWGHNDNGQLGDGTRDDRSTPELLATLTDVVDVSIGLGHGCAVLGSGGVACWGFNAGQLGIGAADSMVHAPESVSGITNARGVSVGAEHTCAVLETGRVACWGRGAEGQLGLGGTTDREVPQELGALSSVAEVRAGARHTCARRGLGDIFCWGSDDWGQLANGPVETTPAVVPRSVDGLSGAVSLCSAELTSCAALADGMVSCWGSGWDDSAMMALAFEAPSTRLGYAGIVGIACGAVSTCGFDAQGLLYCAGVNVHGQLGDGTTTSRNAAERVAGFE